MKKSVKKGIILAGGHGYRLYPATRAVSKQHLTVYDKPMIYYPLSVLMDMNIRDILLIINASDSDRFKRLLGDGSQLGVKISYKPEHDPRGIANAFLIGEEFTGGDNVALILGDNVFCDTLQIRTAAADFDGGALVFGVRVNEPEEYGVAEVDRSGHVVSIEEKPDKPKSDIAVTGLYLYDSQVTEIARGLRPSGRGELEITDVNQVYLNRGNLKLELLEDSVTWFDAGTADSMLQAGNYVASVERTTGRKLGCPEEIAFRNHYITAAQLKQLADDMPAGEYRDYLDKLRRD
ncbi:MAG: glucose-1-phosphate thymidylyltransferase RfbA [Candidatus Zixiibacteriota bacterium]|nr:MAG: glucose-1-phosphate thymidylyltransferase RfbA [candidate division Zixibacteria bacterium]